MHNRKLLAKLSLCAWEVLSDYLKTSVAASADDDKVKPSATIAVQTFGELVNFNPHLHIIASGWSFRCASLLAHATWMVVLMKTGTFCMVFLQTPMTSPLLLLKLF
jgi:hypothetical protein